MFRDAGKKHLPEVTEMLFCGETGVERKA